MSTVGVQPDTTLPKPKIVKSFYLQIKESGGAIEFTEIFNTLGTVTKVAGVGDQITLTATGLLTLNKTIVLLSPSGQPGQTFTKTITVNSIAIQPSAVMDPGDQIEVLIQVFN